MMHGHYILIGQTPVPCDDLLEWARWFETGDRIVRQDRICEDEVLVSTVFLGLDQGWARVMGGEGPPVLFETMVFDDLELLEVTQERCSTWLEAEAQHAAVLGATQYQLGRPKLRLRRLLARLKELVIWMDRYRSREGPHSRKELRATLERERRVRN